MNSDLYGHELLEEERVTFVQHTPPVLPLALLVALLYFSARLSVELLIGHEPAAEDPLALQANVLFVAIVAVLAGFWSLTQWNLIPKLRRLPAIVTNTRVIAPNGLSLPLADITAIRRGLTSLIIVGQNKADTLSLRALPHAKSFHAALERQMTCRHFSPTPV